MNNYFIAVIPEEKIKQKIFFETKKIKEQLEEHKNNLKFVNEELYHITLKFIGKNEEEALKTFDSFNIRFQKFTAFKYDYFTFKNSKDIRVFYINYLACNGNYHLTLFRTKKPIKIDLSFIEEKNKDYNFFEEISFFANKIYLLKSIFENGKLKYKIIKEKETLQNFIK